MWCLIGGVNVTCFAYVHYQLLSSLVPMQAFRGGAKEKNAWYTLFANSFNFRDVSRKIGYFSNPPRNVDACKNH